MLYIYFSRECYVILFFIVRSGQVQLIQDTFCCKHAPPGLTWNEEMKKWQAPSVREPPMEMQKLVFLRQQFERGLHTLLSIFLYKS